jgi:uncharacterized protein
MADHSSLADRLRSLGITPASELTPSPKKSVPGSSIQDVVDGRLLATRAGETFVREEVFSGDYLHGEVPISIRTPMTSISAWAQEARLAVLPLEAFAFLDTETSGLGGGTGTYAFLVGAARFVQGEFRLAQFFMRDPSEEAALLEGLADFLAPCSALVTFNGKAFDAPLLVTRYTLHNIPVPFKDYTHLDLLPLARRLWRDRLPSRALKFLEENILMAPRTSEEVPGYEIPYLYFDYLRTGDASLLKGVFYHNAMDVVAMAALLNHTSQILEDPFGELVTHGLDSVALAKLFEDLGNWEVAARLFERGLEMNLPETDFWQAIQRLSRLQKRRGDLDTAVRLWEQAASQRHVYAHIELAKYNEHHVRNYSEALRWTESAIALVSEQDLPLYEYNHWIEELNRRRERLLSKASGAGGKIP